MASLPWLPVRRRKWCVCPALILLSFVIGCAKTLPSSPQVVGRTDCRDVRAGAVNWRSVRDGSYDAARAQDEAVRETLVQLVSQLAGVEVSSLARAGELLRNETLDYEFQIADRTQQRGRVLDYRIASLDRRIIDSTQVIDVTLDGRVCADAFDPTPLIAAIRIPETVSPTGVATLEAVFSQTFARTRHLTLADKPASATYHDIAISADVVGPEVATVDRKPAIEAVRAELGHRAARGIAPVATNVVITVIVRADLNADGISFTDTQRIERELAGRQVPSAQLLVEMEGEGLTKAVAVLSETLERHALRQRR